MPILAARRARSSFSSLTYLALSLFQRKGSVSPPRKPYTLPRIPVRLAGDYETTL